MIHRELNPNLFAGPLAGNLTGADWEREEPSGRRQAPQMQESEPAPAIPAGRAPGSPGYFPMELKALEGQVQAARAQLASCDQKADATAFQRQEFARALSARLERFSSALKRLEESQSQQQQEMVAKHAVLAGKINERKTNDDKIIDLIERHNVIVRNFENRLVTLQRVLSEQELQLHASNTALEETRLELAKIKRT